MPPLSDYTKTELEGLTPEERSALENEAGDEDGIINEIANGGEGGDDTVDGAAAAPAAAPAAAAPAQEGGEGAQASAAIGEAASAAAAPAAAPAPAAQAPVTPSPAPQPVTYTADAGDVAKAVQEQKDTIKGARAEKRAALLKLNDGEIDAEEYGRIEDAADAKIDSANDRILELNRAATRVEVAAELTEQQQTRAWQGMVGGYMTGAKGADGIDYTGDAGKPLREELSGLTKAFAVEAMQKGLNDANNMEASRWALDQASALMRIRHPKAAAPAPAAAPAASPAPAAAAPATPAAPAQPAAARHDLKTLGGIPQAAPATMQDDPLQKLGGLQGEELEMALARLPTAEVERILAST